MRKTSKNIFSIIKTYVDFLAIISVFGILVYRIDALRKICKNICIYFNTWCVDVNLEDIKNVYLFAEKIFRVIIIVYLAIRLIKWIIGMTYDWWLKKQEGKNRFEESLFRYLHDSSIPRCFLITGEWGSGKTHDVQKFFDKYYRYSRTKVFRVSCFGLDSRNELVKEINNTIEQNDKSFYTLVIKVLQFVPIIGAPIEKFFKKSYGYNTARQGSIFIFDDFERITSRAIVKDDSHSLYQTSPFFHSYVTLGENRLPEFKEIEKEFKSVSDSFQKIENFASQSLERSDFEKYNIAIGLMNELVEIYGMKVIVICNSEVLGERFVHDILRSKLNCMEYRKIASPEARVSMIDNCLQNKTFDNEKKQEAINNYIKCNIGNVTLDYQFDNLRLFGGLLEAFIITANLFDEKDLTPEFMNSLFNSIMITHLAFYRKKIDCLSAFPTGANIEFLMHLYYGEVPMLVRLKQQTNDIKWIDITISGYWIFNLSRPQNTMDTVEVWKTYKYSNTEKAMYNNRQNLLGASEYNMLHILYFQKGVDRHDEEWDYEPYIDHALEEYDAADEEVVQRIIDDIGKILRGQIFPNLYESIFGKLIQRYGNKEISDNTHIHEMYNTFCSKGTLR